MLWRKDWEEAQNRILKKKKKTAIKIQGVSLVRTFFQRMIRTFGKEPRVENCLFGRLGQDLRPKTSANPREHVKMRRDKKDRLSKVHVFQIMCFLGGICFFLWVLLYVAKLDDSLQNRTFRFYIVFSTICGTVLKTWTKGPFSVVFEANMGPGTFEDQETNFGAKR